MVESSMSRSPSGAAAEPSWQECVQLLERLPGLPLEQRLGDLERLLRNSSPSIRDRALRMGAALLPESTLIDYLRNDADGVLRNAGLEMLKLRGLRSFSLAVTLLRDPDYDVALQAVLLLDHFKDPRALEPLRAQLRHEDPNIVQATIVAIGQLGDARAIPDLLPFLEAETWVQVAAVEALGDIRSPVAVVPLARLLTDLMVGPIAAEALARIGGVRAFRCLAQHWLRFENELDAESAVGLLAHVLEGLPRFPAPLPGLRAALARYLDDSTSRVRLVAARGLLALGPGTEDYPALDLVAAAHPDSTLLPACLSERRDLIGRLLESEQPLKGWGFQLTARFPRAAPIELVLEALSGLAPTDTLHAVIRALKKVRGADLAEGLLEFYLGLPVERRPLLVPVLVAHKTRLRKVLRQRTDIATEDQLVLAALLGEEPDKVAEEVCQLSDAARVSVLSQLLGRDAVLRRLPWAEWLEAKPEVYRELAAHVAVEAELRELIPVLRQQLRRLPSPELVRAMGDLRDPESVPLLIELLERPESRVYEPVVLESLGRIGGSAARAALRRAVERADEMAARARMAYKALADCAEDEDEPFFRRAVDHPDWYVRLACAGVMGVFPRAENLSALAQLAADPVPIVAHRAMSFIEPGRVTGARSSGPPAAGT